MCTEDPFSVRTRVLQQRDHDACVALLVRGEGCVRTVAHGFAQEDDDFFVFQHPQHLHSRNCFLASQSAARKETPTPRTEEEALPSWAQ